MVETHWNHPSIIMWVIFNESQGQHDTESLVALTRKRDPSRLINNASGDTDKNCGDVIDKHRYPGPESPKPDENRAAALGEVGGLGLPLEGHTWSKKNWGNKDASSMESLTRGYEKLLTKSWGTQPRPRPLRRDLHRHHRRGGRVQRPTHLRQRNQQSDPGSRRCRHIRRTTCTPIVFACRIHRSLGSTKYGQ